ncbi:tyrosyl-tRNA synthetase [Bartonella bacilliformis str. Heidi Mejia]|uniref:tyrosine--tRNA ligase n=1 Tax=Bartonella bacilliformis TaxID=774 RepID=UPI00044D30C0|nr:tyrosine--tRNA ligase [Bartonella bacilliformis]EYS91962.1 tyrosyl-tRNA synthetase [Bartonella bacilliformis str. Heidi Mejia]KEG16845.1 tyrosyl-tRNA synthetase [Bartonella bacilliformis Cond044]KEG18966.1 tyrosyl-tRNA synthetase [Bartonella bacilliformis Hosp800-02]KEG23477.1 tyrosyl-tRNA synthetase [Bartonella bacilliformis VAB9028]KEG24423.1 tyrosyl-tRNA synthetase [Bartonella bacilliformis CAR600-02]
MFAFKSEFLHVMKERGFIHQISDEKSLDDLFLKEIVTAYIGFDPTSSSLHAGSLLQIMMLYWLQKTGHKPIVLIGGGTGMIGDPSFKEESRMLLTQDDIAKNIVGIKKVFANYLTFGDKKTDAGIVNNAEWLCNINYLEFLRDVGKHFSVNRMLSFDSVRLRLEREHSLSFLEFNYMILQSYDFVELNKRYGLRVQMGGSDQWGNIVNGIELGHRLGTPQLYALTSPLLTTSSGVKMGKSLSGAIWLNADMLSPYQFWQYWRNTEDADVTRFLKLYTTLPMNEIAKLSALQGTEINEAKKILATEITAMLHGYTVANEAAETARKTFEEKTLGDNLPAIKINAIELKKGAGLLSLLVQAGLAKSNSEARRHIQGGGVRVNDQIVTDETRLISEEDINATESVKISFGKKKHILIKRL